MEDTIANDDENISRFLIQYILSSQSVCHENMLLLALMKLKLDYNQFDKTWSIIQWLQCLKEYIETINVKLNPLFYKIIIVNHGIGKDVINAQNKRKFAKFISDINNHNDSGDDNMSLELPESSKFYIYVNTQSTNETKLATKFTPKEIEFIKWSIEQFVNQGDIIEKKSPATKSIVLNEINHIIGIATGDESKANDWNSYITYSIGSTKLAQFPDMSPIETEQVLMKLCDYKWFYRTSLGKFGMDIRCVEELEEYLISTYNLCTCQVCNKIVLQGVTCGNIGIHFNDEAEDNETEAEDKEMKKKQMWHVDCYQHFITHISQECQGCGYSLVTDGIYVL